MDKDQKILDLSNENLKLYKTIDLQDRRITKLNADVVYWICEVNKAMAKFKK